MDTQQLLAEFKEKFGNLPKADFLDQFTAPFLVIQFGGAGEKLDDAEGASREVPQWDATSWDTQGVTKGLQSVVVQLEKSDRNEEEAITLGRSEDNDVVIPHPSISKRHINFYLEDETGKVEVEEAGSTYGSLLNGEPLLKGSRSPIEDRATFVFAGSALSTFFRPKGFYTFLNPEANSE